jgi:hypothetical protein
MYWVDPSGKLPQDDIQLREYQKNLFSQDFYELPKDLQYNQYLLFLIGDEAAGNEGFDDLRKAIENDASYARKFVLTPHQFDAYVKT